MTVIKQAYILIFYKHTTQQWRLFFLC